MLDHDPSDAGYPDGAPDDSEGGARGDSERRDYEMSDLFEMWGIDEGGSEGGAPHDDGDEGGEPDAASAENMARIVAIGEGGFAHRYDPASAHGDADGDAEPVEGEAMEEPAD